MYLGQFTFLPAGALTTVDIPATISGSPNTSTSSVTQPSILQTIIGSLPGLIAAGFSVAQANQVIKINRDRLAQGLPPLSSGEMQSLQTGAQVNVGVSSDVKKMMLYGGIGLAGILGLLLLRK